MITTSVKTRDVVVVGASGFGREVLDVLEAMIEDDAPLRILGVVDDSPSEVNITRLKARGVEYLGDIDSLQKIAGSDTAYVLGVGNPRVRETLVQKVERFDLQPLIAKHPSATLGTNVEISPGVVICAGAAISTNVHLGHHVHINPNATIGHDAFLEDYVSINPCAVISGEVSIQSLTLIGASATVLQGLTIGRGVVVGACACVTKDLENSVVVKGIPAR